MESSIARHSVVHLVRVFLCGGKIQRGPPKSRTAGVINAIVRADEVIEKSGSLYVSYGSIATGANQWQARSCPLFRRKRK